MKVFFIGAGSSYGTFAGWPARPPTAADFGRWLHDSFPDWQGEFPALAQVVAHLNEGPRDLSLDRIWACIDYYAKLAAVLPAAPPWSADAVRDLKKVLLRAYGQRCDGAAEKLPLTSTFTLGKIVLEQVEPGDVVVSFNYDTVAERLIGRRFPSRMVCAGFVDDVVYLAKPHGSVSWAMDWDARRVITNGPDGSPLLNALVETQLSPSVEPLLLGAVPIKSELIEEVQTFYQWPSVFYAVATQWKAVVSAVRDASRFVVLGYGFPVEDQYGRFLFVEAARLRKLPAVVDFYETSQRASVTMAAIRDAFPLRGTSITWCGEMSAAPPAM